MSRDINKEVPGGVRQTPRAVGAAEADEPAAARRQGRDAFSCFGVALVVTPSKRALWLGMSSPGVVQGGGNDRGDTPGRRRNRTSRSVGPSARTYKLVTIWTAASSGLALAALIIFTYQDEKPARVLGTGLVVAAAAAFTGALFGFIFGVPRVLASDRPQGRSSSLYGGSAPIVANTNLEQISDWLTKILVGVGLTQFALIVKAANRLFAGLSPRSAAERLARHLLAP